MDKRIFRVNVTVKHDVIESRSVSFNTGNVFNGYLSEESYHFLIDNCESDWVVTSELVCCVDLLSETDLFDLFKKGKKVD